MLDLADRAIVDALDDFVGELLASTQVSCPPVDSFRVASQLRIGIVQDRSQTGRARLAQVKSPVANEALATVFLNSEPRPERRQWAVAHEMGEHLAPELFARLGLDRREGDQTRELLANAFARRFLLPQKWFAEEGQRVDWDLPRLKRAFSAASHELIAQRMLEMPSPLIVTVFDRDRLTWRRSNQGQRRLPLSAEEIACRCAAHEQGRGFSRDTAECLIRVWPIHEPEWKREIMRTDLLAEF